MKAKKVLLIILQSLFYIFALIISIQTVKFIVGGSWSTESLILSILVFNLTITFSISMYLITISNRISKISEKLHGHIEWHKGRDSI